MKENTAKGKRKVIMLFVLPPQNLLLLHLATITAVLLALLALLTAAVAAAAAAAGYLACSCIC